MEYHDGQTIERGGYRFRVDFEPDHDHEPPWNDGCGQGIVRELRYGEDKRPGDRIIHHDSREQAKWVFEWDKTIAKAKEESWGLSRDEFDELVEKLQRTPTKGEITERAVQINFDWMRGWFRQSWEYVGIVITRITDDERAKPDYGRAVWGFNDDDKGYLTTSADEIMDEYVSELDKAKAEEEAAAELRATNRAEVVQIAKGMYVMLRSYWDITPAIAGLETPDSELEAQYLRLCAAAGINENEVKGDSDAGN